MHEIGPKLGEKGPPTKLSRATKLCEHKISPKYRIAKWPPKVGRNALKLLKNPENLNNHKQMGSHSTQLGELRPKKHVARPSDGNRAYKASFIQNLVVFTLFIVPFIKLVLI